MPPDSTCPPHALVGERQDQPHSGKMDEPESRFWERGSSDGGGGRSNSRGPRERHLEGGKLATLNTVISEGSRRPALDTGTI